MEASIDLDIMSKVIQESNLYALQKDVDMPLMLTQNNFEKFIATFIILILMSMMKVSNSRLYWSRDFDFKHISNSFSRNRWEFIKTNLHITDNDKMLPRNDQ